MAKLVVTYDRNGRIGRKRYEPDDEYEPKDDELIAEDIHRGDLIRMEVDTDADPPELIDNVDYDPRSAVEKLLDETPVRRAKVSDGTNQSIAAAFGDYQTAQENETLQGQIDALETIVDELTDVVTGDTLSEIASDESS